MEKMAQRIHDNKNGLDYLLVGDYYIPDLVLEEADSRPVGRWGRMHRDYLREYRTARYNDLLLSGKLQGYIADLDEQAQERLDLIIRQMQTAENINEALKRDNPVEWVRCMNAIKSRAEEIILNELIYC